MLIEAAGLKRGMCAIVKGFPYAVVDSRRVKYGKGPVFIHVELRDALSDVSRKVVFHPMKRRKNKSRISTRKSIFAGNIMMLISTSGL